MRIIAKSNPLDNFPLLRSGNVEEVRHAFARFYAKPNLTPVRDTDAFNVVINDCKLQALEFSYVSYGAAVELVFPASESISLLLPIRGRGDFALGRLSVSAAAGSAAMIPSGIDHQSQYSTGCAYLAMRVKSRALTEKLAAMTGATINDPVQLFRQPDSGHPAAQMLQNYLPFLIDTLSMAQPPFPNWWITQTEQLVMTLLLCGYRHSYSQLLDQDVPDAAPPQVRRAEEYIEANWQRAVTLEELAEVSGVSAFSLFRAFRRFRKYSPFQFATHVRRCRGEAIR